MIKRMLNLQCSLGHRHFSPTPKLWVGKDCGFQAGTHGNAKTCKRPLRMIRRGV